VGERMDVLELADADAGVDFGALKVGVTEHLLDIADISPVFEHERGHGVPEQMAGTFFGNAGRGDIAADHGRDTADSEDAAPAVEKEHTVVRIDHKQRSDVVEIRLDPFKGTFADRDDPVSFALALTDHQHTPLQLDTVNGQIDQFEPSDAGRVEGFEHGPVTITGPGAQVWLVHDPLHFGNGQDLVR